MIRICYLLSTFYTENNPRTRHDLRSQIERRGLAINEEFAQNLKQVAEQLDSVYRDVLAIKNCCREMSSKLLTTKTQIQDLINHTTQLKSDSQGLQMRNEIATAFLTPFNCNSKK